MALITGGREPRTIVVRGACSYAHPHGYACARCPARYKALSGVTRSKVGITLPPVTIAMCSNCERM